jgi:hypothetical protein
VPTHSDRVLGTLLARGHALDDDELAVELRIDRHTINAVCRKLEREGRIWRSKVIGGKIVNILSTPREGSATPHANVDPQSRSTGADEISAPNVLSDSPDASDDKRPLSGHEFERHARLVLSNSWGHPLESRILTLTGGVTHSFDLVSSDATIVGDAKWYKDLKPIPAAKLSVIAEYVWLLGHVPAARRFIVFGQDRAVPSRWLKRFAPLLNGIEFWFLEGTSLDRLA